MNWVEITIVEKSTCWGREQYSPYHYKQKTINNQHMIWSGVFNLGVIILCALLIGKKTSGIMNKCN
jgi:hypothetical protein